MCLASIWTGLGLRTSGPDHWAPWDNLDTCVSPEHFFVRLLLGIDGTEAARDIRLYEATRLAYVAKRLGKSSMEKVRSALLRNLVLSDVPCRRERLFTWDPVVLEAEILKD